jgi:hypothetical protein
MRPDARLQRLQPRLGERGRMRLGQQAQIDEQRDGEQRAEASVLSSPESAARRT